MSAISRRLLLAAPLLLSLPVLAADPNKPHEHQGKLAAYKGAPPPLSLTSEDLAKLSAGEAVLKQVKGDNGGRGVAVMDIHAAPSVIWSRITNYSMYPTWVDHVSECGVYRQEPGLIFTRFVLSTMGMSIEYYIRHVDRHNDGYLTWTLDYSRNSDFDDSVGYWRVTPLDSTTSRLEYSVAILVKGYVPDFIVDMVTSKGLTNATSWVKKQSEGR